jgi:hypothetical protein
MLVRHSMGGNGTEAREIGDDISQQYHSGQLFNINKSATAALPSRKITFAAISTRPECPLRDSPHTVIYSCLGAFSRRRTDPNGHNDPLVFFPHSVAGSHRCAPNPRQRLALSIRRHMLMYLNHRHPFVAIYGPHWGAASKLWSTRHRLPTTTNERRCLPLPHRHVALCSPLSAVCDRSIVLDSLSLIRLSISLLW